MKTLRLIFLIPALLVGAALLGASAQKHDRAKARHYFLLGAEAAQQDLSDQAYEYYKKAYRTDPTFEAAAFQYGQLRLENKLDTLSTRTELDSSLRLLRQFADAYPDELNEGIYYGYVARIIGNFSEAADVYRRLYNRHPDKTSLLLNLASIEQTRGNLDSAITALDTYERIEGSHPQLSISRLRLLIAKGDTLNALKSIDHLVETHPLDPQFLLVRAYLNEAIGDTANTRRDYLAAERVAPDNGTVKMALSDWAISTGDTVAYERYTTEAIYCDDLELDQKKELLRNYIGKLLADSTGYSKGEHLFEVLNQQYPHNPEIIMMEAAYRTEIGEEEEAVELMRYATDLEPEETKNWNSLMALLQLFDRSEEALQTYRSIPASTTKDFSLMSLAAFSAVNAGKPLEGVRIYEEMLDSLTGSGNLFQTPVRIRHRDMADNIQQEMLTGILGGAGDAYYQAEMPDSAFAVYDVLLQTTPPNAYALNNYAYFISEKGSDMVKAEQMSREAIDLEPDNPTYLDTYGWIQYRLRNYEEAESYLRKAIEIAEEYNGANAEYYNHLAEVLKEEGKAAEAREASRRAAELESEAKKQKDTRKAKRNERRREVELKRQNEKRK